MKTEVFVIVIVLSILALAFLIMGILQLFQKGFLLNNAYIYASKEERERMNKKPYYIQSGVVFISIALVFVVVILSVILNEIKLLFIEAGLVAFVIVYTIISIIKINKNRNQ